MDFLRAERDSGLQPSHVDRMTSKQWLNHCIDEAGGFLPLEAFIQQALYNPEQGYYTCHIKDVGSAGDFATSASLSQLLGRGIAQWALGSSRLCRNLVEVGGGSGALAASVIKNIPLFKRLRCRVYLTEISPRLQEIQKRKLSRNRVRWFTHLADTLDSCGGEACVYSNELMDAFPCIQFIYHGAQWQVLGLERDSNGEIRETYRPPETTEEKEALAFMDILPESEKEGRRLEVQWSIRHWLKQWSDLLQRGVFLVIDYGDENTVLQKRSPFGSLRAYFQHQPLEGEECYRRMGRQDLTVDVNFTHLELWMKELGWTMTLFQNQREFLQHHVRRNGAINLPEEQMLIHESGAGSAFKVACFEK